MTVGYVEVDFVWVFDYTGVCARAQMHAWMYFT
jgi:hypothetical protein